MTRVFDIAVEPREDSPEELITELRILRELLADGFYESAEVTDVVARAVRNDLRSPREQL